MKRCAILALSIVLATMMLAGCRSNVGTDTTGSTAGSTAASTQASTQSTTKPAPSTRPTQTSESTQGPSILPELPGEGQVTEGPENTGRSRMPMPRR